MKKKNKMSKQIKCYNINYLVEEEDLLANQSFNSIDDLHNSLPKEVIFGKESVEEFEEKLNELTLHKKFFVEHLINAPNKPSNINWYNPNVEEFEEKLADNISDETGWLVKSFDWKVEESPTIFYDKENSLDRFMKGKKS